MIFWRYSINDIFDRNMKYFLLPFMGLIFSCAELLAQTHIEVNLDVNHQVGEATSFYRKQFMYIHSDNTDRDWNGEEEKKHYLMKELDVYFGRETGSLKYQVNQVKEDPKRMGYADEAHMKALGAKDKK